MKALAILLATQTALLPSLVAAGPTVRGAIPGMPTTYDQAFPAVAPSALPNIDDMVQVRGSVTSSKTTENAFVIHILEKGKVVGKIVEWDTSEGEISARYGNPEQFQFTKVDAQVLNLEQGSRFAYLKWTDGLNQKGEFVPAFNVGELARLNIFQPDADSTSVHQISSLDPTQILGRMDSNGKVYLFNQNGILFGEHARVNVHSLTASTLNIDFEALKNGGDLFVPDTATTGQEASLLELTNSTTQRTPGYTGVVENRGQIVTDNYGRIFLVGTDVANHGTLQAPGGGIYMAAGNDVVLRTTTNTQGNLGVSGGVTLETGGTPSGLPDEATLTVGNTGTIVSDLGRVVLDGHSVKLVGGEIRATTSAELQGRIDIRATDKVTMNHGLDEEGNLYDEQGNLVDEALIHAPIVGGDPFVGTKGAVHPGEITVTAGGDIEHGAHVVAPGGDVKFAAGNRIYLDANSTVDVSGEDLVLPAEGNVVEIQYTSQELIDEQLQKFGVLLGAKIRFLLQEGAQIGNLDKAIDAQPRTAKQLSIDGGNVEMQAGSDIIARAASAGIGADPARRKFNKDALIDISGGVIEYESGALDTSQLKVGDVLYDIGEAPNSLVYDSLVTSQTVENKRFGDTTWEGLYTGSYVQLVPTKPASVGFTEGGLAGRLFTIAPTIVMEGDNLRANTTLGIYQEMSDFFLDSNGLRHTANGIWDIGIPYNDPEEWDPIVKNLEIDQLPVLLDAGFGVDSAYAGPSRISSQLINTSGLQQFNALVQSDFRLSENATVAMPAGSLFAVTGRRIDVSGDIRLPGGTVDLRASGNKLNGTINTTTTLQDLVIRSSSEIDVSGRRVDNSQPFTTEIRDGYTDGGLIALANVTQDIDGKAALLVLEGALLKADGGYHIDQGRNLTVGDAGIIDLTGGTVVLDGTLYARSMQGGTGGTLNVHADSMTVVDDLLEPLTGVSNEFDLPAGRNGFWLGDEQLARTGITHLSLKSADTIVISQEVHLQPSRTKLAYPESFGSSVITTENDAFGTSSISLHAGEAIKATVTSVFDREDSLNINANVVVAEGAVLTAEMGGAIDLKGPGVVVEGILDAQAGTISATASKNDLVVGDQARLLARGGYRTSPDEAFTGGPRRPLEVVGGEIFLTSNRDLLIQDGALLDVSGSDAVTYDLQQNGSRDQVTVASDPGSISLTFGRNYSANETSAFRALSQIPRGFGGTFSLENTNANSAVNLDQELFDGLSGNGFDSLNLRSVGGLTFTEVVTARVGRQLTLDAPALTGQGHDVTLNGPWIRLLNTQMLNAPAYSGSNAPDAGTFKVNGEWIDVVGQQKHDGFKKEELLASRDLRFSDYDYGVIDGAPVVDKHWQGNLETDADLILGGRILAYLPKDLADAINQRYNSNAEVPISYAFSPDFHVRAKSLATYEWTPVDRDANGNPFETPVYGGGGNLTFEVDPGSTISHAGVIRNPNGTIDMIASGGTLTLESGSLTSVAGQGLQFYGAVENEAWFRSKVLDQATGFYTTVGLTDREEIESAPEKGVRLTGKTVDIREAFGGKGEAVVDISGGGYLAGYQFQPSLKGTIDPLKGGIVVIPSRENDPKLPGEAIWLSGIPGVETGLYSIVPEEYAVLNPDALVLFPTDGVYSPETHQRTAMGYPIVGGYRTYNGTPIENPVTTAYYVRNRSIVGTEGEFAVKLADTPDGGFLTLEGESVSLAGVVQAHADVLNGGVGGRLLLPGTDLIRIVENVGGTPSTGITLDGDNLSASGFGQMFIGMDENRNVTASNVIMEANSSLSAEKVFLGAQKTIRLVNGSRIEANSTRGEGEVGFFTDPGNTDGEVIIEAGARVESSDSLTLGTNNFHLQDADSLDIQNSALNLVAQKVIFGERIGSESGLFVEELLQGMLPEFETLTVSGTGLIDIREISNPATITGFETLQFNTPKILSSNTTEITFSANTIRLGNDTGSTAAVGSGPPGGEKLAFDANTIEITSGNLMTEGFKTVSLGTGPETDLRVLGQGSFRSNGDLEINGVVNVMGIRDAKDDYQMADFVLATSSTHNLRVNGAGAVPVVGEAGGILTLEAGTVGLDGTLNNTGGLIDVVAEGGVTVGTNGRLLARGNDNFAGGEIRLTSKTGTVKTAAGSVIDVSAGSQGDAGTIEISSSVQKAEIAGTLLGQANGGQGGSFTLDTAELSQGELSTLSTVLKDGGFSHLIDLRTRNGGINVAAGQEMQASLIRMAADSGSIDIAGVLNASGAVDGGQVELFAGQDLILTGTGSISARGATGQGGTVALSARDGQLNLVSGSAVDLTGTTQGGTLDLQARWGGSAGIQMNLQGNVIGASHVQGTGWTTYQTSAVNAANINTWTSQGQTQISNLNTAGWTFTPDEWRMGFDVQSTGDITLTGNRTMFNFGIQNIGGVGPVEVVRFESNPFFSNVALPAGVLSVRAAGNVRVQDEIKDQTDGRWDMALVAGADLSSANRMQTRSGTGDIVLQQNALVDTWHGKVSLASGNDLVLNTNSAVQSHSGDIHGHVGGDLSLGNGAIRTVGLFSGGPSVSKTNFADHSGGGDIRLDVAGRVTGVLAPDYWGKSHYTESGNTGVYGADYLLSIDLMKGQNPITGPYSLSYRTRGIATMGDGNVSMAVGEDVTNLQAGTFGEGDLTLAALRGLNGRFQTEKGASRLTTLADFSGGVGLGSEDAVVIAQGDIQLDYLTNVPMLFDTDNTYTWNLTYASASAATLAAVSGDLVIDNNLSGSFPGANGFVPLKGLFPATVVLEAGRDVRFARGFAMAPGEQGFLSLEAGRDIIGIGEDAAISMNDQDPGSFYGLQAVSQTVINSLTSPTFTETHSSDVYRNNLFSNRITAGRDIVDFQVRMTQQGVIKAGRDIRHFRYVGQNHEATDVTRVMAGRDLVMFPESAQEEKWAAYGIQHGGPGSLIVSVGNAIDLGRSRGIYTLGSALNKRLPAEGSNLFITVGYDFDENLRPIEIQGFFDALDPLAREYARTEDTRYLTEARADVIAPFIPDVTGTGQIDMVSSAIIASGQNSSVTLLTPGDINVGRSSLTTVAAGKETGIQAQAGGALLTYTVGDVNVNESRMVAFGGNKIFVWSDRGNINAGRGSRFDVRPGELEILESIQEGEIISTVLYAPPSVGSGISAPSSDPDGILGPQGVPEQGDIILIAAEGEIDAGEAGISGGNLFLAANEIINAQNISFSVGSVGVPSGGPSISLGALAGGSSLTEAAKVAEEAAGSAGGPDQGLTQEIGKALSRWFDVEVIQFNE